MKAPRPRRKKLRLKPGDTLNALDRAAVCCRNIATLSALLSVHDDERREHLVPPELLAHAGWMIFQDAKVLAEVLRELPFGNSEHARIQQANRRPQGNPQLDEATRT